ncbi:MAG TPA: M42 family metallopeptidase [Bacilli bacterium]|mgnify:CR=1 FL=1|jgi:putative aminopeptidase FrvX|nr:MAG: Aminopeptidase YpdE [Tenericutes bacterium ADurb.Bin140]HOE77692.1 M42 family metallopeptidase [Bacilli bacterium]HON64310.1 M42 family metallopeptidase [Bacilli bacterium]HOR95920.1 M42 family metallopeptidase [Bacilli bacterium]HPD12383.1 M42 family metallopeptidase [Bacilli bacterium]
MIEFDLGYFKKVAEDIFRCDSPTGYTKNVIDLIKNYIDSFGYESRILHNGALEVFIKGEDSSKVVATSAHCDTLGLMVRSIKSNGKLALTALGGPITPTLDGEYCVIYTRDGRKYTGTILSTSPAAHVYKDANSKSRNIDELEVRLDEKVFSKEDVEKLGIQNGDIVCYDTKFMITDSGFLKTRFIDDKASVVILLMLLKYTSDHHLKFKHDTKIYFVVYEEVGHGASMVDKNISEFVTLDMGCVGLDLAGNEYAVSICAKDSGGPYDYELTTRLINLAKENGLTYTVDIFPFYGSDIGAASRAGVDFKGALIGSGVSASHGMERTHIKGIENTLKLIYAYLVK